MKWPWSRKTFDSPPGAKLTRPRPAAQFSVDVPPEMLEAMTAGGTIAPRISRAEALQVPAVLRARNLICGTLAGLPLRIHGPDRRTVDGYLLGGNVDPDLANAVVIAQTYEDLLFEGVSWWRVTRWGWHGYPIEARHVPVDAVHVSPTGGLLPSQLLITEDQRIPVNGQVYIDGRPVDDGEIIRFDSANPPLLRHAARAIRTCLRLDRTAAQYAEQPMPLGMFTEEDGAESLEDEEIAQLLADWDSARQRHSWAYISGLKPTPLQWDAEKIQLADQRQHAVLEIARAAGVDPEDLGVSTTSRTYANAETRRLDLLDFTLSAYVTALEQRLSMRDILPRGYEAKVGFDGFLRSDTKTRMETYKVGLEVGAYTEEEIRELEDRPSLPPTVRRPAAPPPMPDDMQPEPMPAATKEPAARFDAGSDTQVSFDDPELAATFRVNAEKRTISGLLVPWGKVARSGFSKWRFAEGSLYWVDEARVKLNLHHDHTQAVARAVRLQSVKAGLDGSFKVARGEEGDRALSLAEDGVLDGFSIEIDFEDGDGWQPDPADESVRLVDRAKLRGVALTAMPAFDDARVDAVAATLDRKKEHVMSTTTSVDGTKSPSTEFDFDDYMTRLGEKTVESHKQLTEQLGESIGESVTAGFKAALEALPNPQDGPQTVRAARYTVTREAPIYQFNGDGHSLVRDVWTAKSDHDPDALERLRRYRSQTAEVAKLVAAEFATVTTGNASQVIPPGYRPELYVPELIRTRPLVSACSQGTIVNGTPFVVPVFSTSTGATADHVEGVNPTDGSLTFGTKTVTPGGISGKMILTREIVDSANPAVDQIALATMRESYARQTEAKVYTLLNGANGAGGVITGDFVPSGAQASTVVAPDTAAGSQTLLKHIRERMVKYPFNRFGSPTLSLMGQNAAIRLSKAEDNSGRPLLPSVGAQNAAGMGNAFTQGWFVDGLAFVPSWAMTGVAAGDSQIFMLNQSDAWVWESPLLTFRYEEKSGPANIELALFGYFATHVLRPVGLSGIRITLT